MVKINEACVLLGVPVDDKGKGTVREIVKFFGVKSEDAPQTGHLKAGKLYDEDQLKAIKQFKDIS
jgi:hypothetical protein